MCGDDVIARSRAIAKVIEEIYPDRPRFTERQIEETAASVARAADLTTEQRARLGAALAYVRDQLA